MALRTQYEFVLPRGYLDDDGEVHRRGVMRLATARDELEPVRSAAVTGPDAPRLPVCVPARGRHRGGSGTRTMKRYPAEALWQELAYLAYHLHWDIDDLLDLEHADRARLVTAVASLNARAWEAVQQLV